MFATNRAFLAAALLAAPVFAQTTGVSQPGDYGCPVVCASQNDPVTTFTPRSLPNEYAHGVRLANATTVGGFSFYFQTVSLSESTIQAALYRENPASPGQPDVTPAGSATMVVGSTLDWYTAVLDTPVALAAGELFFISADTNSVRPPDDGAGTSNTASPSFWRRPPFGGTAWAQTGIINSPIFRIHCAGSGGVVNHTTNEPRINTQFDMNVAGAQPGGFPNFVIFGANGASIDLGPLGAGGCTVLVTPNVIGGPALSDAMGAATYSFSMPNDAALVGSQLKTQILSATTDNSLGFKLSNVCDLTIGG